MTRMDTTKFIAEVNILKSRPCLNLWSRWSPWRPCWWVPPVPGVCSFHHGRCCFSTNCSNWQSSAQSLLQICRYYLDIYIESYLYLYVHARFQNSILLFDLAKLYFISRKFIIYSPTKSLYLTPCAKIIWTKTFTTTQYHSFRLDRGCGRHPRFERHLSRGLQHTHRHCRRRRWHIAHGANGGHERTMKSRPAFWPAKNRSKEFLVYCRLFRVWLWKSGCMMFWCFAHISTTVCKWWNIIWTYKMRKNKYRTNIFFSTWTKTHNTKCFPLHLFKHGMFISLISQVEYLQNSKFWWTFHDFLSQQAETIQQTAEKNT